MKKNTLRKLFAVLMSAVMLLGLLAGCDKADSGETTGSTEETSAVATPIARGMLVVNANGAVNVSYDEDGLVLELEGADENGEALISEYPDFLGESCSTVVCTLIKNSSAVGYLAETNYVIVKQAVGSELPGTNFLAELEADAKAALETVKSEATLLMIPEEDLDENGYIALATAKDLALGYLDLTTFDLFDGSSAPVNGVYGFTVAAGDIEENLLVDAVTGAVCEGVLDSGDDIEDENLDEVVTEPTDSEDVFETTPSETATQATDPTESDVSAEPEEGDAQG